MNLFLVGKYTDNSAIVGYSIYNLEKGEYINIPLDKIQNFLYNRNVSGICLEGNTVKFTNGSVGRYTEYDFKTNKVNKASINILVCYEDAEAKSKSYLIEYAGETREITEDNLIKSLLNKRVSLANGKLVTKGDLYIISAIKGSYITEVRKPAPKQPKQSKYDLSTLLYSLKVCEEGIRLVNGFKDTSRLKINNRVFLHYIQKGTLGDTPSSREFVDILTPTASEKASRSELLSALNKYASLLRKAIRECEIPTASHITLSTDLAKRYLNKNGSLPEGVVHKGLTVSKNNKESYSYWLYALSLKDKDNKLDLLVDYGNLVNQGEPIEYKDTADIGSILAQAYILEESERKKVKC